MKFRLLYQGEIKTYPKQRARHINDIRAYFSAQLKRLLEIPPYSAINDYIYLNGYKNKKNIVKKVGGLTFIPIISPELDLVAELDILIMHPEVLGTARADIDNRLKTLLDGLRRPQVSQEITDNLVKKFGNKPIYTLFDDDRLVTKITVNTTHLLEYKNITDMVLVIAVNIRASKGTKDNLQLILQTLYLLRYLF